MSLLTQASLILTPNAYKANKLYSIIPSSGNGDMTTTRATTATRINSSGIVETVASNVPRLDYTSGVGSILLEPQRTNLITYSEDFSNSSWVKAASSTVISNTILSPSGNNFSYTYKTSNIAFGCILRKSYSFTFGSNYTYSCFIKKSNYRYVGMRLGNTSTTDKYNTFDFDTETINNTIDTNTSLSFKKLTNSWYILSISGIVNSGSNIDIALTNSLGATGYTPTGTEELYIWSAQLEQGAYATSYIPTVASTVTRNLDDISRTGIYTNNFITSAGGTWFFELDNNFILNRDISGNGFGIGTILPLSSGNGFLFRPITTNVRSSIVIYINGVSQTTNYTTLTDKIKVAIKWNGTTADVFVNSEKKISNTTFTATNMQFLNFNGADVPRYVKSTMLFPTPLTDAECASLTTL